MYPYTQVTNHTIALVKLHNVMNVLITCQPSVAPGDYGALNNFHLIPLSNDDVHQQSFNVSIVNDSIPEDPEMFSVSLTLDPAAQARLDNRVIVSPDVATVTIQDDEGKSSMYLISTNLICTLTQLRIAFGTESCSTGIFTKKEIVT